MPKEFLRPAIAQSIKRLATVWTVRDSNLLVPVAARSKTRVCGCSTAGIAGLNPARGMVVCVVCCRGISDMRTKDIKVHNG